MVYRQDTRTVSSTIIKGGPAKGLILVAFGRLAVLRGQALVAGVQTGLQLPGLGMLHCSSFN
jgi:hypothetical protein